MIWGRDRSTRGISDSMKQVFSARAAADAVIAIEPVLQQSERERVLSKKIGDVARLLRYFYFFRFVRTLQREPSQDSL